MSAYSRAAMMLDSPPWKSRSADSIAHPSLSQSSSKSTRRPKTTGDPRAPPHFDTPRRRPSGKSQARVSSAMATKPERRLKGGGSQAFAPTPRRPNDERENLLPQQSFKDPPHSTSFLSQQTENGVGSNNSGGIPEAPRQLNVLQQQPQDVTIPLQQQRFQLVRHGSTDDDSTIGEYQHQPGLKLGQASVSSSIESAARRISSSQGSQQGSFQVYTQDVGYRYEKSPPPTPTQHHHHGTQASQSSSQQPYQQAIFREQTSGHSSCASLPGDMGRPIIRGSSSSDSLLSQSSIHTQARPFTHSLPPAGSTPSKLHRLQDVQATANRNTVASTQVRGSSRQTACASTSSGDTTPRTSNKFTPSKIARLVKEEVEKLLPDHLQEREKAIQEREKSLDAKRQQVQEMLAKVEDMASSLQESAQNQEKSLDTKSHELEQILDMGAKSLEVKREEAASQLDSIGNELTQSLDVKYKEAATHLDSKSTEIVASLASQFNAEGKEIAESWDAKREEAGTQLESKGKEILETLSSQFHTMSKEFEEGFGKKTEALKEHQTSMIVLADQAKKERELATAEHNSRLDELANEQTKLVRLGGQAEETYQKAKTLAESVQETIHKAKDAVTVAIPAVVEGAKAIIKDQLPGLFQSGEWCISALAAGMKRKESAAPDAPGELPHHRPKKKARFSQSPGSASTAKQELQATPAPKRSNNASAVELRGTPQSAVAPAEPTGTQESEGAAKTTSKISSKGGKGKESTSKKQPVDPANRRRSQRTRAIASLNEEVLAEKQMPTKAGYESPLRDEVAKAKKASTSDAPKRTSTKKATAKPKEKKAAVAVAKPTVKGYYNVRGPDGKFMKKADRAISNKPPGNNKPRGSPKSSASGNSNHRRARASPKSSASSTSNKQKPASPKSMVSGKTNKRRIKKSAAALYSSTTAIVPASITLSAPADDTSLLPSQDSVSSDGSPIGSLKGGPTIKKNSEKRRVPSFGKSSSPGGPLGLDDNSVFEFRMERE